MEEEIILKKFNENNMRLSPDALELLKIESTPELLEKLLSQKEIKDAFIITRDIIENALKEEWKSEKKIPLPIEVHRKAHFQPLAKELTQKFRVIEKDDVSGKSKCTGKVEDFVKYFRDRFRRTKEILRTHTSKTGVVPVSSLKKYANGREVRIIGIVSRKHLTKKGNLLIEIEDEEGAAKVVVLKDDRSGRGLFEKANSVVLDEIIAVDGKVSDPFLIASDIIWPDLPTRNQRMTDVDICIAFLSDLHVGSRFFLEEKFRRMLQWLNGDAENRNQRDLAGRVKYLLIAGDIVDGIGIYPKQEKELIIRDIYKQYSMFVELLEDIPDYIEIIISPGNHDAVRRAEPQPRLPKELIEVKKDNVHCVGNPCTVEIEGLRTLIYHGTSLDSIISSVHGLDYQHPEKSMLELIKRRNLSLIYGENPIVPEEKDYMLIDEIPDIVHMGHLHKNGYANYRGVFLVNSGTWQDRTYYQIKQGHVPSPCILPIYEAHYGRINLVNFAK